MNMKRNAAQVYCLADSRQIRSSMSTSIRFFLLGIASIIPAFCVCVPKTSFISSILKLHNDSLLLCLARKVP